MKLKARIWTEVPDVLDGYYVEILSVRGQLEFQENAEWWPTVAICEAWAVRQGATIIKHLSVVE